MHLSELQKQGNNENQNWNKHPRQNCKKKSQVQRNKDYLKINKIDTPLTRVREKEEAFK